jgi:hypothetical protein
MSSKLKTNSIAPTGAVALPDYSGWRDAAQAQSSSCAATNS